MKKSDKRKHVQGITKEFLKYELSHGRDTYLKKKAPKYNKAETEVRALLKTLGFTLDEQRDERHKGVDIVALKKGEVLLIEVKKARLHSRAWEVDAVSFTQTKACNTIAIVTPYDILFMSMKDHLKLCKKNGTRYVTEEITLGKLLND